MYAAPRVSKNIACVRCHWCKTICCVVHAAAAAASTGAGTGTGDGAGAGAGASGGAGAGASTCTCAGRGAVGGTGWGDLSLMGYGICTFSAKMSGKPEHFDLHCFIRQFPNKTNGKAKSN